MTGKEDDFKPTASYEAGLKGDASRFENHTGTLVNAVQGHYMRNLSQTRRDKGLDSLLPDGWDDNLEVGIDTVR